MKRISRLVFSLLLICLCHTSYSQKLDRMYVPDTLSNARLARMFYSMAADASDSLEQVSLYRMALERYELLYRSAELSSTEDSLNVLINMAVCNSHIDSSGRVAPLLQEMLYLAESRYGVQTQEYADAVRCAARVCDICGDHAQAHDLYDMSLELVQKYGSGEYKGFSAVLYSYYLFGRSYNEYCNGRVGNAYRLSREADKVMRREGISDDVYSRNLRLLTAYAGIMGRSGQKQKNLRRATGQYTADMMARFASMSEMRRSMYWESASTYFDDILSAAYGGYDAELCCDAYDALLFSKGLLLNTSVAYREFIGKSGCAEARRGLHVLDSLVAIGADPRQIDSADMAVVRILDEEGLRMPPVREVRWQDVRDALGKDDLAIEFFRLNDGRYGALLLRKGWKSPKMVELGDSYKIRRKVFRSYESEFIAGDMLDDHKRDSLLIDDILKSKAIWGRGIMRHFPLTDEGRVFFSPDGIFHQTGIEYLPLYTSPSGYDGSTVLDNYKIYRVSSTRELAETGGNDVSGMSASIYGGMMFNPSHGDLGYAVSLLSQTDSSLVDEFYEEELDAMQDDLLDSLSRDGGYIRPLPKTLREVHEVDDVVSEYGSQSRLYTGVFANEDAFKQKTYGQHIIHVATHGFYVTASDALGGGHQYYRARFSHNPAALSDPMYRSGLHFAGAAPSWAGYADPDGLEDGVLTAKEVSLMNLSHADLVVLSACHTGAGEISKDGVYGLQRAFKKAGAKSTIMSLWGVNDNATYLMRSSFYHNRFVLGMSKYEAFVSAQRQLRNIYPEPYYWRAFILLDPEI